MKKRKFTGFLMLCILLLWLMMPVKGENNGSILTAFKPEKQIPGIIYAYPQPCMTLDPAMARDDASALIISNIFEGLVRFSSDSNEIEPCLAKKWTVSEDGLQWTFYLERGVVFHDGTPFNAKAVEYSIERQTNDNPEMIYSRFVYGPLKEIIVIDDYTIKFILKYPYAPFLNNLAMPFAAPVVSPTAVEQYGDEFAQKAVGTGPYKLSMWDEDFIEITRNNNYWGKTAKNEAITFLSVPLEEDRVQALKEGKAHLASHITPEKSYMLKPEGYEVYKTTGLDISYLGLYVNKPPFSYHAVRQAVDLALDRVTLVKETLSGNGIPATSYLPPPIIDTKQASQVTDIPKAKELLSSVPLKDKLITIITYSGTRPYNPAGGEAMARAVAEQLKKIGLQVNIKVYSWDEYKKALASQEGDAFIYGWISDNADPDNFLYPSFSSAHIDSGLNATHFVNQEVDTLLLRAQRTQQLPQRRELYLNTLDILEDEKPWAVLNHSLRITATCPALSGYVPHPTGWDRLSSLILK